jgi:hypothetical protein
MVSRIALLTANVVDLRLRFECRLLSIGDVYEYRDYIDLVVDVSPMSVHPVVFIPGIL